MIKIDNELKELIQPLSANQYQKLELDILSHGCINPLIIWNNLVIDGHNRFKICTQYKLKFNTVYKDFFDKNSAKLWIINNQLLRKDLEDSFREELLKKLRKIQDKINQVEKNKWIQNARKNFNTGNKEKCFVCGKYENITQAHHIYPLHLQYDHNVKEPINDYIWLCPNHHTLVHLFINEEYDLFVLLNQNDIFNDELNNRLVDIFGENHLDEMNKVKEVALCFRKIEYK